ncbi:MAG: ribonuclease HII [Myxococcales bacterium]|nr:MAG: ribonuclease HII [Myxococcales bacterium]
MSKAPAQLELLWDDGAKHPRLDEIEKRARASGYLRLIGADEAGRGPLAGPVVAAAVALPDGFRLDGLNDSKQLSEAERLRLFRPILNAARAWAVAFGSPAEIDRDNILRASLNAMARAVAKAEGKGESFDLVVVDGNQALPLNRPQWAVVHGDARCMAVAAASVVAKVVRDLWMQAADRRWPDYGFARHKGYPTSEHRAALARLGPCPIHRRTFRGVREIQQTKID